MIDGERLRRGDRLYFDGLVREFSSLVYRIASRYSHDQASCDDLFQDIWIRVWQRRASFRSEGSFVAWLMRVAHNVGVSRLRSDRRRAAREEALMRDPDQRAPDPLQQLASRERLDALFAAILELPSREREALLLRLDESVSTQHAAERMGVKPATVRSLVRNGVRRLSTQLRRQGDDPS